MVVAGRWEAFALCTGHRQPYRRFPVFGCDMYRVFVRAWPTVSLFYRVPIPDFASPSGRIKIRVGNHRFHTTLSVMTQWKDSRLAKIFTYGSNEYSGCSPEDDFQFIIERDGTYFQTILLWLRTGELDGPIPNEERFARALIVPCFPWFMLATTSSPQI